MAFKLNLSLFLLVLHVVQGKASCGWDDILSLSMYVCVLLGWYSLSLSLYIYMCVLLGWYSLPLSLSLYIYIYMCACVCIHACNMGNSSLTFFFSYTHQTDTTEIITSVSLFLRLETCNSIWFSLSCRRNKVLNRHLLNSNQWALCNKDYRGFL